MTSTIKLRPWDAQPGDRILGTNLVVADRYAYSQGDIGSDRERQFYTLPLTNGRKITYNGESWLTVLRPVL